MTRSVCRESQVEIEVKIGVPAGAEAGTSSRKYDAVCLKCVLYNTGDGLANELVFRCVSSSFGVGC